MHLTVENWHIVGRYHHPDLGERYPMKVTIKCDGVPVSEAIEADTTAGWVWCYARDLENKLMEKDGQLVKEMRRGTVTAEFEY